MTNECTKKNNNKDVGEDTLRYFNLPVIGKLIGLISQYRKGLLKLLERGGDSPVKIH